MAFFPGGQVVVNDPGFDSPLPSWMPKARPFTGDPGFSAPPILTSGQGFVSHAWGPNVGQPNAPIASNDPLIRQLPSYSQTGAITRRLMNGGYLTTLANGRQIERTPGGLRYVVRGGGTPQVAPAAVGPLYGALLRQLGYG